MSKEKQQQKESEREYKKLPLDHCALSLQPFNTPVCTKEGIIFDLEEIERYIRLESDHRTGVCECPVTGKPLKLQDLFKVLFYKNSADEYACPVTGKVFAENSKVFANIKSGQVYSAEVVEQMCESGIDFISDQPCCRSDYIPIIDPEACASTRNCAPRLNQLKQSTLSVAIEEQLQASKSSSSIASTNGKMAAALTSTLLNPVVKQECLTMASSAAIPRPMKNGKVVIRTTHGDLEAVLFASTMPITVFNFTSRAKMGHYCNVPILSINESVCITGCCYYYNSNAELELPCKLRESPHKNLLHNSRGMMGMCVGEDDSTSQFYITFQPTPQFDFVNRVFGKLDLKHLATQETLQKLESVACCKTTGMPTEYTAILDIIVMMDPFSKDDTDIMKKCIKRPANANKPSVTVGKYLAKQ